MEAHIIVYYYASYIILKLYVFFIDAIKTTNKLTTRREVVDTPLNHLQLT